MATLNQHGIETIGEDMNIIIGCSYENTMITSDSLKFNEQYVY
jgi:hypothetical protein